MSVTDKDDGDDDDDDDDDDDVNDDDDDEGGDCRVQRWWARTNVCGSQARFVLYLEYYHKFFLVYLLKGKDKSNFIFGPKSCMATFEN